MLLVPDNLPPHKPVNDLASNEDRLQMLSIAVKGIPGFEISDIEYRLGGKSYTGRTLRALQEIYPDTEFSLLIGSDMLYTFREWKEYEFILKHAFLIAAARRENEFDKLSDCRKSFGEFSDRIAIIKLPVLPISSTQIRRRLKKGLDVEKLLPDGVYEYIKKRGIYLG